MLTYEELQQCINIAMSTGNHALAQYYSQQQISLLHHNMMEGFKKNGDKQK